MALLEDARAVADQGPCDACLGRCFAERGHGLTDAERGRGLRVALSLADDEPVTAVDPADCWVCEGLAGAWDSLAEAAVAALGDVTVGSYQVGTRAPPLVEENERLLREEAGLDVDAGETFRSECNREVGKRVGRALGIDVDLERPDVLFLLTLDEHLDAVAPGAETDAVPTDVVEVQVNPAFVYGRYRKLERDVPQTEWPCTDCDGTGVRVVSGRRVTCEGCDGSGYRYDDSVEGFVAPPVRDAMDGTEALFHGAGREDVDARMLGGGRPFVVEVKEPRSRFPDVAALEERINRSAGGAVEVRGLALATHGMVERVKEHRASKRYRLEVRFDAAVEADALADATEALSGATVEQDTPERVDHRRASKTRTRTVYAAEGHLDGEREATVEVHGEGGLYVKELCHGDDGRTEPSLAGLLGVGVAVEALDVLAVEGEGEPFEDPSYFLTDPNREGRVATDHR